jgi:hypothetical protein
MAEGKMLGCRLRVPILDFAFFAKSRVGFFSVA